MKNLLKHPIKFLLSHLPQFIAGSLAAVALGAGAATLWVVLLNGGSSGQGQSTTVSNITIAAVSSPSPTNLLYPGATGDVVATITNPNSGPVTITAVNLPANTVYAAGFTNATLTTSNASCTTATPSDVIWNFSTAVSGTSHTLTTPLVVAANSSLVVTLTNDASMTNPTTVPAACEGTFFQLPSFTGVTASLGAAVATTSPATDGWTS
jgi:hypothetical protein